MRLNHQLTFKYTSRPKSSTIEVRLTKIATDGDATIRYLSNAFWRTVVKESSAKDPIEGCSRGFLTTAEKPPQFTSTCNLLTSPMISANSLGLNDLDDIL